jgi:hypothetical protein
LVVDTVWYYYLVLSRTISLVGNRHIFGVDGFINLIAVVEMVFIMMVDDATGPKWKFNGDIEGWLNLSRVMYSLPWKEDLKWPSAKWWLVPPVPGRNCTQDTSERLMVPRNLGTDSSLLASGPKHRQHTFIQEHRNQPNVPAVGSPQFMT